MLHSLGPMEKAVLVSPKVVPGYRFLGFAQQSLKQGLLYNTHLPQADWIDINFNQVFTSCQSHFRTIKNNNYNVGNNLLSTRLAILNGKVLLEDLNLSLDSFKVKYKKLML